MDVKRTNTATLTTPRPQETVGETKAAPRERTFDDAFARVASPAPDVVRAAPSAPPKVDVELVADLTNRRVSANIEKRKEATKTRQILDAHDREIARTAEQAREEAGRIAQELDRRSAHGAALARAELDATIAAENGVTPLASKVVNLSGAARVVARPGARLGPAGGQMELRLKSLLA